MSNCTVSFCLPKMMFKIAHCFVLVIELFVIKILVKLVLRKRVLLALSLRLCVNKMTFRIDLK